MREISLTQGQAALVDDEDFDELNKYKWQALWDKHTKSYYAHRTTPRDANVKRKLIAMHRQIISPSPDKLVDHINGNTLDNRKENLREVTNRQNLQNWQKPKSSKYPGVNWNCKDKRWRARIVIDGKEKHLGNFNNEWDAFVAYRKALIAANEEIIPEWSDGRVYEQRR